MERYIAVSYTHLDVYKRQDSMCAAFNVLAGNEVSKDVAVDTFIVTADNVADYGTDGWQ